MLNTIELQICYIKVKKCIVTGKRIHRITENFGVVLLILQIKNRELKSTINLTIQNDGNYWIKSVFKLFYSCSIILAIY